ncbi:hypothetical protein DPMN_064069 [Dreissena polymorpha]|uniref:Uncharacterized protein n=1 Tax=Dreissena polymorpha TaxID=45954 RepID=A0A9D4CCY3_DREPO|nr:hypothetical protein DPMN_064069 [Dreissena polymorpha]
MMIKVMVAVAVVVTKIMMNTIMMCLVNDYIDRSRSTSRSETPIRRHDAQMYDTFISRTMSVTS